MVFDFLANKDTLLQPEANVSSIGWKTPEETYIPNYQATADFTPEQQKNTEVTTSALDAAGRAFANQAGSDIGALIKNAAISYQFGDTERKATCLWLKNLPKLVPTNIVEPEIIYHKSGRTDGKLHFETMRLCKEERSRMRSKTFPGIAHAMAEQWSRIL